MVVDDLIWAATSSGNGRIAVLLPVIPSKLYSKKLRLIYGQALEQRSIFCFVIQLIQGTFRVAEARLKVDAMLRYPMHQGKARASGQD